MAKRIMRIKKRQQDTEEQEVFENPDTEVPGNESNESTETIEDTEEDFNEQLKKMLDKTTQEKPKPFTEQLKKLAETQKLGSKEISSGESNVDHRLATGRKLKAPVGNRAPKVSSRK